MNKMMKVKVITSCWLELLAAATVAYLIASMSRSQCIFLTITSLARYKKKMMEVMMKDPTNN